MKKYLYLFGLTLGLAFSSLVFTACGDDDDDDNGTPTPAPVEPGSAVDPRIVGTWAMAEFTPHHPSFTFNADGTGYEQFTMNPDEDLTQIERRGGTFTTVGDSLICFTYKYFLNEWYDNVNKKVVDSNREEFPAEEWYTDSIPYTVRGNSLFLYNGYNEFKKQ